MIDKSTIRVDYNKKINYNYKVKEVDNDFKDIFKKNIDNYNNSEIIFSKHAIERLENRNINLSKNQIDKIEEGIKKAKNKGIKESLVLVDNLALVINIDKKIVITAMDKNESKEKIFTNIDGAIII